MCNRSGKFFSKTYISAWKVGISNWDLKWWLFMYLVQLTWIFVENIKNYKVENKPFGQFDTWHLLPSFISKMACLASSSNSKIKINLYFRWCFGMNIFFYLMNTENWKLFFHQFHVIYESCINTQIKLIFTPSTHENVLLFKKTFNPEI